MKIDTPRAQNELANLAFLLACMKYGTGRFLSARFVS
jgi:hypothetical protein